MDKNELATGGLWHHQIDSKLSYNLNDSSSDSLDSSDYYQRSDDIFIPTDGVIGKSRLEDDLKKAVKKRTKNREMKFNNLAIGDEFIETMAELLKKDNNLQQIHL